MWQNIVGRLELLPEAGLLMQSAAIAAFLHCDITKVLSQCLKSNAKQWDFFLRSQPDSAEFHSTCAAHLAERGG